MSSVFLSLAKQVKNQKDMYIKPENLKKDIVAFGVRGTLEVAKPEQEKTVSPATTSVEILPDTNYVLSKVTVDAVDNTIDSNIVPENIKNGVSILGVNGELVVGTDTSDANATASDILLDKTAYVKGEKVTGTFAGIPIFDSEEEMRNAELGATEGDRASVITYKYEKLDFTQVGDNYPVDMYFPDEVVYSEPIVGTNIYSYNSYYGSGLGIRISPTSCEIGICDEDMETGDTIFKSTIATYSSNDGLTYTYVSGDKSWRGGHQMYRYPNEISKEWIYEKIEMSKFYKYYGSNSDTELEGLTNLTFNQTLDFPVEYDTIVVDKTKIKDCLLYINSQFEPQSYDNYLIVKKQNGSVYAYSELVSNNYWHGMDVYVKTNNDVYVTPHWSSSTPMREYILDLENSTATYTELEQVDTFKNLSGYKKLDSTDVILFMSEDGNPESFSVNYDGGTSTTSRSSVTNSRYVYHYREMVNHYLKSIKLLGCNEYNEIYLGGQEDINYRTKIGTFEILDNIGNDIGNYVFIDVKEAHSSPLPVLAEVNVQVVGNKLYFLPAYESNYCQSIPIDGYFSLRLKITDMYGKGTGEYDYFDLTVINSVGPNGETHYDDGEEDY